MCLLAVLFRTHPEAPLLVGANRDELLERPATAMTVLEASGPRILGGRDHAAGGTWLAVNEHGLVAALTNRPGGRRDPSKRSRGSWPLFLARHRSAGEAAAAFVERFDPGEFNPGWVLVGDRSELVYVDMTVSGRGRARTLEPGLHVLENRPLEGPSAKADLVRGRLAELEELGAAATVERLAEILRSHDAPSAEERRAAGSERPGAAEAACVHLGPYGTRSSTIVRLGPTGPPRLWSAEGPPCTHRYTEATPYWAGDP